MTDTSAAEAHVDELPEFWAEHDPQRPAVVDGATVLSYGEWDERANRIAAALNDPGLPAGPVAVRMHQSQDWFVLNLALAKVRRELVAVNWRLTPYEVGEIVLDCAAQIIVLDDEDPEPVRTALRPHGTLVVTRHEQEDGPSIASWSATPATTRTRSKGPVRVLYYSSGTTGKPKGVRGVVVSDSRRWDTVLEYLGLDEKSAARKAARLVRQPRTLLTLPLHHGIGPKSAESCHRRGGTVYLLDRYDPSAALELIERHRITHWTSVPTMLRQIRALPAETLAAANVSSMRKLSIGSAPSSRDLRQWVIDFFGNCLYEGYGAAEVGMVTVMRPRWRAARPDSCGRLRPHVSVRIRDEDGTDLPRGEIGEVWARTPVTINGYIGEDPLSQATVSADGHFRTGDVGWLDEESFLYITGRAKDMIVAGGVNIYPAEIEAVLEQHPDVVESAVFGIPEENFGEQVMAVCEIRPGATPTAERIRAFIAEKIAPFKLPRVIELVDELPRNAMDKVVKDVLREPHWRGRDRAI